MLFFYKQSAAQPFDEQNFTVYTVKDGLSDNRITAVEQDKYGYLWVATQKGLNRFDGNTFINFYSDSSAGSLPMDDIQNLNWLTDNVLAATTRMGVFIINTLTLLGRSLIIPADSLVHEYKVNHVEDVKGDEEGNIYILTRSGFYQFNSKYELQYRFDYYTKQQVEKEYIVFGRNMAWVNKNELIVSSINGPYIFNAAEKKLHRVSEKDNAFTKQAAPPGKRFYFKHGDYHSFSVQDEFSRETFYFDLKHKTAIPVTMPVAINDNFNWRTRLAKINDSLFTMNGKEKGFYLVHYNAPLNKYEISPELYFENNFCQTIFFDKEQRLWIATNNGLYRRKRSSATVERFNVLSADGIVNSVFEIRNVAVANNKLFVATAGEGLLVFNRDGTRLLKQIRFDILPDQVNNALYVTVLNSDTVIAAISNSLVYINTNNLVAKAFSLRAWHMQNNFIAALFKDSRNSIYASSNKKEKSFLRKQQGEKEFSEILVTNDSLFDIELPRYIMEDNKGDIWFAGHGLSRLDTQTGKFDFKLNNFPKLRVMRREVSSPVIDKTGKLYFGIQANGLVVYDMATKKFEQYSRSHGLPDNNIRGIYLHNNILWLGTESGIASFDIVSKKISAYGIADNMPALPFTSYSFFYDSLSRKLYGAFGKEIVGFNPEKLDKNSSPPKFFIESISVTGKEPFYHPAEEIKLNYRYNSIVVNLTAIDFEDAYQQQFAYRFANNGDEVWQQTGSQRNIIFSNLLPGRHKLQFKVYINNNTWPEQIKEIIIVVRPPFWQTTWFIILTGLLLAACIFTIYKYRVKSIRQKANNEKQLAQLEMKGLHAQMNPHFIFNSLNSIREMILNNENKDASHYLSKFAHLIRITLDHSAQPFVSLRKTINYLERYLEMEQIRNSKFTSIVKCDDALELDETLLPPMLVQPFIENALVHGVSPGHKDINIQIEFKKEYNQLVCTVEDNGIGLNQSIKDKEESEILYESVGLSNIRNRISLLNEKHNIRCSLEIKDKSELSAGSKSGTLVTLKLPLKI